MSPQASDELRAEWPGWDREALNHLESRGYTVLWDSFQFRKPSPDFEPSERDWSALAYLADEFDYGGLIA